MIESNISHVSVGDCAVTAVTTVSVVAGLNTVLSSVIVPDATVESFDIAVPQLMPWATSSLILNASVLIAVEPSIEVVVKSIVQLFYLRWKLESRKIIWKKEEGRGK